MAKTILFIATMDTKFEEIEYASQLARQNGCDTLILDCNTRYPRLDGTDYTPEEVLAFCGMSWEEFDQLEKGSRIDRMAEALARYVPALYESGKFDGVMSIGGSQNSNMASTAMKACPYGVPKIVVSTLASGKRTFDLYIGNKDIMVMHSVTDIAGLNSITEMVINNSVAAMTGMVNYAVPLPGNDNSMLRAAITLLGITTRGASRVIRLLEEKGIETIAFHANGVGGACMEELVERNYFDLIIDMNLHEITCETLGGLCEGAYGRLNEATINGIPQVIVPGAADMLDFAVPASERNRVLEETDDRQRYFHNATIMHTKVTKNEIMQVADVIAERLNQGEGPITVLLPLQGFCEAGVPGGALYNPETDLAFIERLKAQLKNSIKVVEVEANINDEEFANAVYSEAIEMLGLHP